MAASSIFSNKKILIGLVVVVLIILGGVVVFAMRKSSPASQSVSQNATVKNIKPEEIGLTLTPRDDKKGIIMKITKLENISSVEYEVSYDALTKDPDTGEMATTPRGVIGSPIKVNSGDSEINRNIDLGTCSRNVCVYDKIQSDIKFTIKVNFRDGSVGSVEKTVSLQDFNQ